MNTQPKEIYEEYRAAADFKASLGTRGLTEQNAVNERFYIGDQWHGARCGNDRPLVRHNVIKRIGEYKMSQILGEEVSLKFQAEGIASVPQNREEKEIRQVLNRLSDGYDLTAERVRLDALNERLLRNAFVTGSGVLYTYWDPDVKTGLFADLDKKTPVKGDINCEVLDIDNVFFGDPYASHVQNQPYILFVSHRETADVLREAGRYGASPAVLSAIAEEEYAGKIMVLTKLFKEYQPNGDYTIKSVRVTEHQTIRPVFDTGLTLYPLSLFQWERRGGLLYGESEVTYLIPNQIAINRMITANVWSAMTTGMPMMVINGDTVPDGITNEPGQIIKVFGSNEDVAGAVKYVAPPVYGNQFESGMQALIENTMTQSGANEVALGDSRADNATALMTMRNAALMPLNLIKGRFYSFLEETARIWADLWLAYYGNRMVKIKDENGIAYVPFQAAQYRHLLISTKVEVGKKAVLAADEQLEALVMLYEKGILDREELIRRIPDGILTDKQELLQKSEDGHDRI